MLTDENGCRSRSPIKTLSSYQLPFVDAGPNYILCPNLPLTLTGSGTATMYQWSNNAPNNQPFIPTLSGFYSVIGTDVNGCSNTDSTFIDFFTLMPVSYEESMSEIGLSDLAFNVTTGAQIYVQPYNNILPVFSGQTLPVIASSSDSPLSQPASFVWISSDNVVFVGEFSPTLGLNGTNATLPVVFADKGCALAHNDLAVCLLASGGIAVLKAHSPTNPSILWTNYVKPLYIAKDIGPSGILVVDTDVGGFNGGVIAGLELMTGEALWTWAKPNDLRQSNVPPVAAPTSRKLKFL